MVTRCSADYGAKNNDRLEGPISSHLFDRKKKETILEGIGRHIKWWLTVFWLGSRNQSQNSLFSCGL